VKKISKLRSKTSEKDFKTTLENEWGRYQGSKEEKSPDPMNYGNPRETLGPANKFTTRFECGFWSFQGVVFNFFSGLV
jgi:hypothetical protein